MKKKLKKDVRSLIRIAEAIDRETEKFNRNFKEQTSFGKTRKLVIGLKKLLKEVDSERQINSRPEKNEVKEERKEASRVSLTYFLNPYSYLNDMSDEQLEVFMAFKKWITENNITENPWFNDSFLLRFCRARKFDIVKIQQMFSAYMDYRKENGIDDIIAVSEIQADLFYLDLRV